MVVCARTYMCSYLPAFEKKLLRGMEEGAGEGHRSRHPQEIQLYGRESGTHTHTQTDSRDIDLVLG